MPAIGEDDSARDTKPKPDQRARPPHTAAHRRVHANNRAVLSLAQVSRWRVRCPGRIRVCGTIAIQRLPNLKTSQWRSDQLQSALLRSFSRFATLESIS